MNPNNIIVQECKELYLHDSKINYLQHQQKISKSGREELISLYPALESHKNSLVYRKMFEYLSFRINRDKHNDKEVMFPAALLAIMADRKSEGNNFTAITYLQGFSDDVLPLKISDWIPLRECRTVNVNFPKEVLDIYMRKDEEMVWFVSGKPVSPKSRRKFAEDYEERCILLLDGVDEAHPAYELMNYLNNQPKTTLGKILRSNWNAVEKLIDAMPDETQEEVNKKLSAVGTLRILEDYYNMFYDTSTRTSRISVKGVTIHNLPRGIRKAALAGCIELDIRSSQLSIVARLWDLPKITKFLSTGQSFWCSMLQYLNLSEISKYSLKTALYSICFGMGKKNIIKNLAESIGKESAIKFIRHELVKELLQGRREQMKLVKALGGLSDAFGKFYKLSDEYPSHAILAIVAQSWELRLMLSVYESMKAKTEYVNIVSWLHDGCTVYFRDKAKADGILKAISHEFDSLANELGFITELEIVPL